MAEAGLVPEDLLYTTEHEWLRLEDGLARVGITAYAQNRLGDVVYVTLPRPGSALTFMGVMGEVESVKVASEIFSPVSGEVVESNEALADTPELVNQDPYGRGWLLLVRPSQQQELDQLLSPQAYAELVRKELGE